MNKFFNCALLVLLSCVGVAVSAAEREAQALQVAAPIVAVEPITRGGTPICDVAPPQHSEGLAATLRWDLYGRCRPADTEPEVTGYRVTYEWDGRRFDTVLAEPPSGDTLALDLQIY